jgi:hypothetical protein
MTTTQTPQSAAVVDVSALPGAGIKPWLSLQRHPRAAWLVAVLVLLAGLPFAWIRGQSHFNSEAVFQVAPTYMKNLDADKELELQSNSQYREFVNHLSNTVVRQDVLERAVADLKARGIDLRPAGPDRAQVHRIPAPHALCARRARYLHGAHRHRRRRPRAPA